MGQCGWREQRRDGQRPSVHIGKLSGQNSTIGTQADITRMLSRGLFWYFMMAPEAKKNWVKYMARTLTSLVKTAQNVHKSAYFSY